MNLNRVAVFLWACSSLGVSAAPQQQQGVLCFMSSDAPCAMVKRARVTVAPSENARPFVWVREDGKEAIAGVLRAGARSVDLLEPASVRATVATSADRWPVDVTAALEPGEQSWTIANAAFEFTLNLIGVSAGEHTLRIAAPHHASQSTPAKPGERGVVLGRIALRRLPVISGRVVARTGGEGLPAAILLAGADSPVFADAAGEFEAEVSGDWPDHLRIDHPGHGTRVVPLAKSVADVFLGPLDLVSGVTLEVALTLPAHATVELYSVQDDEEFRIASRTATEPESRVSFASVGPGRYRVVVRGKGPLQKYGEEIHVKAEAGDVHASIGIEAVPFELSVTQKAQPVAQASVLLNNDEGGWSETVVLDADGRHRAELWQSGTYRAIVTPRGGTGSFHETSLGTSPARWDIRLSERRIRGSVTDANARGIADAVVFLTTESANTTSLLRTSTDAMGRFEYGSVDIGRQTITADASGYVGARTELTLDEADAERVVNLRLARARRTVARILLANGSPAAGALILTDDPRPRLPLLTDAAGRAEIDLPEEQKALLYILPREGSFAIASADSDSKGELAITIPDGVASIVLRAQDVRMQGIPNVHILMRYNGRLLPAHVARDMGSHQGRSFLTAGDGRLVLENLPLGVYDFWPFFRAGEEQLLRESASADAPARIAVQPGTNSVILTFARRRGT